MGKILKSVDKYAELIERSWLGLENEQIDHINPFDLMTREDKENPDIFLLNMMRKPENFPFTCKTLFNFELFPYQNVILNELWYSTFPMFLASRGAAKSSLTAMYLLLRALFLQGRKIVVVAPGFRQAKNVMNYIENYWNNSPIVQDIVSGATTRQGPVHDTDRWQMVIGRSTITALPIGDGERIRGERANDTYIDELQCLGPNTLIETSRGILRLKDSFGQDFKVITHNQNLIQPNRFVTTPPTEAFKVTTKYGYDFICSNKHKVYTLNGWKLAKDLTTDDYLIMPNYYKFPETSYISPSMAKRFGQLTGKQSEEFKELGVGDTVPWSVLQSSKKVLLAYLEGLGELTNLTYELATEIQILLYKLDVVSEKIKVGNTYSINKLDIKFTELQVESVEKISDNYILYDYNVPKDHSFMGNGFVQHNSFTSTDILERVIGGFAIVSSNPVEKVKHQAKLRILKDMGVLEEDHKDVMFMKNQQLISGTAYYSWNHFAKYHAKWKAIIESRGDLEKLKPVFTNEEGFFDIPDGFDWRDYSIIRLPVDLLPDGYMDKGQVARAKATMHTGLFESEYGCLFIDDSTGYFRASLINSAVATESNIEQWKSKGAFKDEDMLFTGVTTGDPSRKYVIGVDPAAERDNFAVVVLELHESHRRVVYCWTFNKKKHRELIKLGQIQETDYFAYVSKKLLEIVDNFPTEHLGIDWQGGGNVIGEALHNHNNLDGRAPLWPIIEDKEKDTDHHPGRHIIHPIQFANQKWTCDANAGLRKDLEDKVLLFPMFDSISLIEAEAGIYDTTEEIMMQIEEIKNELVMIVHTKTANSERWDTPDIKVNGKKGRQVKDRYSALLIANAIARSLNAPKAVPLYSDGISKQTSLYVGPDWFSKAAQMADYGFA